MSKQYNIINYNLFDNASQMMLTEFKLKLVVDISRKSYDLS